MTTLLTARMKIATYRGLMKAFVTVIRRRNKQIEIFVNVKVAKVYGKVRFRSAAVRRVLPAAIRRRSTS